MITIKQTQIISLMFIIITASVSADTHIGAERLFYYSFDKKVFIEEVPCCYMVKKKTDVSKSEIEVIIGSCTKKPTFEWFNSDICTVFTEDYMIEDDIDQLLTKESVLSVRHVYNTSSGKYYYSKYQSEKPLSLGLIDLIVLNFKDDVSQSDRDDIKKTFGLTSYKKNELFELCIVPKEVDILDLSIKLFETGCFVYAYPELISKSTLFEDWAVYPNDTYFQYQVTLHNTGQTFNGHSGYVDADIDAPEAWALTMGRDDIVVAVIDEGVTSNHPDLPNSRQVRLNGSNFGSGDPDDPSPTGNYNHGNACAGVIAATANNGEGIAGIAPLCKIMPVRVDESSMPSDRALAIHFASSNGAKILSNSWGYGDPNTQLYPCIIQAINAAVGRGCLVIFSAGNNARHQASVNGYVSFPANNTRVIDGLLSVGASDRYDHQADYSPTSLDIDIVAPSNRALRFSYYEIEGENLDMWTIDIPGNYGYNPWHIDQGNVFLPDDSLPTSGTNYLSYTGHFGGTSHSCPVVAGVAALVLSMNSNLTPQMVSAILKTSADKVGGYTYIDGRCDEMGYGRVNANNAVQMVCDTTYFVNTAVVGVLREVQGCDIYMKNSGVTNNGILKVRAKNSVTIDGIFQIRSGSKLEIRHYSDY